MNATKLNSTGSFKIINGGIKMASEDNFLRLDPYNYNTEIEREIKQGNITVEDLFQLFLDGYVPMETVIEALGYTQD